MIIVIALGWLVVALMVAAIVGRVFHALAD